MMLLDMTCEVRPADVAATVKYQKKPAVRPDEVAVTADVVVPVALDVPLYEFVEDLYRIQE
jgi:hypothetical protein